MDFSYWQPEQNKSGEKIFGLSQIQSNGLQEFQQNKTIEKFCFGLTQNISFDPTEIDLQVLTLKKKKPFSETQIIF